MGLALLRTNEKGRQPQLPSAWAGSLDGGGVPRDGNARWNTSCAIFEAAALQRFLQWQQASGAPVPGGDLLVWTSMRASLCSSACEKRPSLCPPGSSQVIR